MKKILPLFLMLFTAYCITAQNTISTYPGSTANNGSAGITFEITTTQPITINEILSQTFSAGTSTYTLYHHQGAYTTPPNISAAGGWTLITSGTSSTGTGTAGPPVTFAGGLSLVLNPGVHGIHMTTSNCGYKSWAGAPDVFTDGIVTIKTGTNFGYGGGAPNPTFHPRQFCGSVIYTLSAQSPNDAGVASLDSPTTFCAGTQNIVATIKNYGNNQINPVTVNWSFNGVTQTPVIYSQTLDTLNGTGPNTAQVLLGTRSFTAGVKDEIRVWTSNPNNVTDTSISNDSVIAEVQPSLIGTFTINPVGTGSTNYATFNDAVDDLNQYGICGPVVFNVKDGTYNEQVDIGDIAGTSEVNTIIFKADANNSGPVLMSLAASTASNYIVNFNGSNWVAFDGIDMHNTGTYGTNVSFAANASNNTVMNARLSGNLTTNTTSNLYAVVYSNGTGFDGNKIINDTIIGGSMGIYFFGSTTVYNQGTVIEGNTIQDAYYMGMYLYGNENMRVTNNHVFGSRPYTSGYAIYDYYGGANNIVASNTITNRGLTNWPLYGILVGQQTSSSDTARSILANNNIHVGNPASTSTHYGLYMTGNIFTDMVYNNVAQEGSSTTSRAGFVTGGGLGVRVLNNNFLHYGAGYGLYTFSTSAPICDNNNTASAGPNIGYFNTNTTDLAAWKAAGGGDNTISVDSIYVNLDSLRTCDTALFAKGTPVSGYAVDIDGDFRNPNTPNIGSDEYVASSELFTIGDTIEFCGGDDLVLGKTMNDATFLWSNGKTTPTITVTTEGNYSVIVDGPCATGMTDDVEVVDVNPVASFTVLDGDFIRGFNNQSEYGTSYLWEFGDGATSTEVNPFHIYAANGTYEVKLTVMNYCDTVSFTQTVGIYVGINEISFGSNISIYPNPANDFINIAIGDIEDQSVQMEIVDMKGQVYANRLIKITGGSTEQIDVSSLSKGVYLVRLTTANEVATKQIVVQ